MLKLIARALRQPVSEVLSFQKQYINNVATLPLEREVQEVQIPVPWGHIAGKWWGPQNERPVLCLHGFQDNAGTWDTLAPLLPNVSLLAVDMPGHGLSSHIPLGTSYHILDFVLAVQRIVNYYGWQKVSLMGHSFGSIQACLYSSIYPERVEHYIALDAIKPISFNASKRLVKVGEYLDHFLQLESLDPNNKPSYTYEEAVEHLHNSIKKWATKEGCEILTRRGTVRLADGRYCFSRDPRLKAVVDLGYTHSKVLHFANNINCKVLNIKALQGLKFMESPEKINEFLDVVKNSAKLYEYHTVEGSHHVHLDFPERVASVIADFLKK